MKQVETDKIERFIKGDVSEDERREVESLLMDGEHNLYLRSRLQRDWENILKNDSEENRDLSHVLDRIHHIIRIEETSRRQKPLYRLSRIYTRIAAIIAVPLMIGAGVLFVNRLKIFNGPSDNDATAKLYAPMGSRIAFTLPDGTTGMLNSGSQLSYTLPFSGKRHVSLDGEAWFDVKHDKIHPFEIAAGSSKVKVMGTSFNISAYSNEDYLEIVLKEGMVEFSSQSKKEKNIIIPSEKLVFKNGEITKTVVDPGKYNAWTEGRLVFRGDNMDEIVRRIERWYNVKIYITDDELYKYSFRATFQDDDLEDVLKFLCLTSPIKYSIKPREMKPDGSIQQEEIILSKRK